MVVNKDPHSAYSVHIKLVGSKPAEHFAGEVTGQLMAGRHRDLNRSGTNPPSAYRITNIALNGAVILPYNANPGRMGFSERTTVLFEDIAVALH